MTTVGRERIAVETAFRDAYGQAVATLTRAFGDLTLAEDAVQDAFIVAAERWERDGVPPEPAGWIVTAARRKAIDRLRREKRGSELHRAAALTRPGPILTPGHLEPVADDMLRLIFTCCHPTLKTEHQIALTLRLVGGLEVADIARSFIATEAAIAKRLVRAKYKIREAGIPYRVPQEDELPDRIAAVLHVVYLIYTAGLDDPARPGLRQEAIRLSRALVDLMPDEPEVVGLLALLLSSEARADARGSTDGPVLLRDQDRSRWDHTMIAEARRLLVSRTGSGTPGQYQIQAAIQATHNAASSIEETDWPRVVRLYDALRALAPTPIVALNRAIAVGEMTGPAAGLAAVDAIGPDLDDYHLLHATRGTMLRQSGDHEGADAAFRRAASLAPSDVESRRLLSKVEATD